MPRNYRNRTPSCVTIPIGGATINYGFNSGLKDTDRAAFGQTVIDFAAPPAKLVFGANSPKPYRASKRETTGYTASFCSHDKVATLRTAGYSITNFKSRTATKTVLSKTYVVDIGGIAYAWIAPNFPSGLTDEDLTALGVQLATASDEDLVFGASMPKPARYSKEITGGAGEGTNRVTVFIDPTKEDSAVTAGWTKVKSRKTYTIAAGG